MDLQQFTNWLVLLNASDLNSLWIYFIIIGVVLWGLFLASGWNKKEKVTKEKEFEAQNSFLNEQSGSDLNAESKTRTDEAIPYRKVLRLGIPQFMSKKRAKLVADKCVEKIIAIISPSENVKIFLNEVLLNYETLAEIKIIIASNTKILVTDCFEKDFFSSFEYEQINSQLNQSPVLINIPVKESFNLEEFKEITYIKNETENEMRYQSIFHREPSPQEIKARLNSPEFQGDVQFIKDFIAKMDKRKNYDND